MTLSASETDDTNSDTTETRGPTSVNGVKADELKRIISRIEVCENTKAGVLEDIKLIKAEAKSEGFDIKTITQIIKLRKMDATTIEQEEMLLSVYKIALGMDE